MKTVTRTKSNDKGQVTIPKKIRDYLGIKTNITLILSIYDNSLLISPLKKSTSSEKATYLKTLQKTQGSWSGESSFEAKKRKLELKASKNRKLAW